MKLLTYSTLLAVPLALWACGEGQDEDLLDESAALSLISEDEAADGATEGALAGDELDMDEAADEQVEARTEARPEEGVLSCNFQNRRQEVLERFDTDGNGKLDADEKAALREEVDNHPRLVGLKRRLLGLAGRRPHYHVWKRIRWAFDVDGDHHLSETERADMIAALEARCERRRAAFLEQWDADGDGELSRDEIRAALDDARDRWEERRAAFLAQYDTNGDGALDRMERAAVREAILARREMIRANMLEMFDANGNGALDPDEIDAVKAFIRERIAEGPLP